MHFPAIAIEPNVSITYNANDKAVIGQTIPIAENASDDIKFATNNPSIKTAELSVSIPSILGIA